jgi:hypothetical protein
MSLRRWSLTFVAAFAFVWISNGADAPGIQLVRESGSDTLHGIANTTHGAIKWSHGAFLYMESGYPPAFYTLDREGNWIYSAAFRAPNGALAWSNDYDRETDGSIVLAGQYSSDQGAVPFLAWISVDGKTQRLVPTTPYFPYMLSVAPDGTVWTIGHEMINGDPKAPGLEPDAGVLRHFDGTGKLLGSALPQSRFKTPHEKFRLHSGFLVAKGDRLGWYGPREGNGQYVEISTATMAVQSYPGLQPAPSRYDRACGLAVSDSGVVTVQIEDRSPLARATYSFDRATSKWVPLQVPAIGGYNFTPILAGTDGESLVFRYAYSVAFFAVPRSLNSE